MKKINLVYVIKYYYPLKRHSGILNYICELADSLSKKVNLTVITYRHSSKKIEKHGNYTIIRTGFPFDLTSALAAKKLNPNIMIFGTGISYLFQLIPYFLLFKLINLKKPVILHQHIAFKDKNSLLILILSAFFKKIICSSPYIKNQFSIIKDKAVYIPPGVNIKYLDSIKGQKKGNKTRIGYFGHLNANKGAELLLDAFIELNPKNTELIMAGEGPLREKFLEKAKDRKNIKILGYTKEVKSYIKSCDFLVFPFRTSHKILGVSQTAIEAVAMSKPLIITDTPSLRPLLNKNGFIFKNKEELKKQIELLIRDRSLAGKMAINSKKIAKSYDIGIITENFLKAVKCQKQQKIAKRFLLFLSMLKNHFML